MKTTSILLIVVMVAANLQDGVSQQIGFSGMLYPSGEQYGKVPFDRYVTNYGNAFTPSTGTFKATVAGLYFFSMTATAQYSNFYPKAYMYKNGQRICDAAPATGNYGQSISCSTVQHLSVDDRVYVSSFDHLASGGTSFSGFLIVAD